MSGFHIKPDKVSALAEDLNGYSGKLNDLSAEVGNVRKAGGISASSYWSIQRRIKSLTDELDQEKQKMGALYSSLQTVNKLYSDCENSITGRAQETAAGEIPPPGSSGDDEKPWYEGISKESLKLIFGIIEKAGDLGGSTAVINAIIKILADNDGLNAKDAGAVIKGLGKTIISSSKMIGEPWDWAKALGLNDYKALSLSQTAGWMGSGRNYSGDRSRYWKGRIIGCRSGCRRSGSGAGCSGSSSGRRSSCSFLAYGCCM